MVFIEEIEEEEEEEDYPGRPAFRPTTVCEDFPEPPGVEDLADAAASAAGAAAGAAWRRAGGAGLGGLNLDEDEDELGAFTAPEFAEGGAPALWRQALLTLFLFAGTIHSLSSRRPSEASFQTMRDSSYPAAGPLIPDYLAWAVQADRSLQGRVAWSRYVDHGPIALGTVALTVGNQTNKKVYEHRYLGIMNGWVPLPYLPQPGKKADVYGVGVCVLARCACVPKRKGGCLRFQGGKSATLNFMALPNLLLFGLWQFPSYWGQVGRHASLSLSNLAAGRLHCLLLAPFSHRSWAEAFKNGLLLATAVDSFDRAEAPFVLLLGLYLLGSWAAFLARTVFWRRLWKNEASAYYFQEYGASAGLAAQLVFLARARPSDRFQFSLYLVPTPVQLSAWQSLFAHAAMDIVLQHRGLAQECLAHLAAWTLGWLAYDAWTRHV